MRSQLFAFYFSPTPPCMTCVSFWPVNEFNRPSNDQEDGYDLGQNTSFVLWKKWYFRGLAWGRTLEI